MALDQRIAELELASKLADAELGVAEDLSWGVAAFAAIAAQLKWDSWLLSGAICFGVYIGCVMHYRKRSDKAEDAYFRAASLGKYATNPEQSQ